MKNPWTKKNPLLSLWLSGANAVAGSVRGRATREIKRQTATAMTKATGQMLRFWSGGWMVPTTRKRKKSR